MCVFYDHYIQGKLTVTAIEFCRGKIGHFFDNDSRQKVQFAQFL